MNELRRWALALWLACAAIGAPAWAHADTDAARQLLVLLQLPPNHFRPDSTYAGSYGDALGASARRRVAARIAREHGLGLGIDWPMPLLGVHCYVMSLPEGEPAEAALSALARDPAVAWAQPMHVYRTHGAHADPLFPAQPTASAWQLAELHDVATGREVRVAVIDSGVETGHPDLAGQVLLNQNFVDDRPPPAEGHGTAVASIIAARADNGAGIAGIAPQARLLALRACWQAAPAQTLCTSLGLAKALYAAIQQDAQIINMSLSGPDDRLLGVLLDQALARGVAVVAALPGRGGAGAFPANHPGVFVVGSAPPLPTGAILAPGRDVPSAAPGGGWSLVSGSSFAAAHASGLLALVRELDGARGTLALKTALVTAAEGRIDSCATLARYAGTRAPACKTLRQTPD